MDRSVDFTDANGTGSRAALLVLGKVLVEIHKDRALREQYLRSQNSVLLEMDQLDRPPEKKGVDDLIDDIFGKKDHREKDDAKKEEGKFKKWLDGVFKKKTK